MNLPKSHEFYSPRFLRLHTRPVLNKNWYDARMRTVSVRGVELPMTVGVRQRDKSLSWEGFHRLQVDPERTSHKKLGFTLNHSLIPSRSPRSSSLRGPSPWAGWWGSWTSSIWTSRRPWAQAPPLPTRPAPHARNGWGKRGKVHTHAHTVSKPIHDSDRRRLVGAFGSAISEALGHRMTFLQSLRHNTGRAVNWAKINFLRSK